MNAEINAISPTSSATVTASTDHWIANDRDIDTFELQASRRALTNLRTLLYGEPMLKLIERQVEESEANFKKWLEESDGKFTSGRVKISIQGISTEELFGIIAQVLGGIFTTGEARRQSFISGAVPAHPEHYSFAIEGAGGVETMGGLPTLTFPAYVDDADVPDFIREQIDTTYDVSRVGRGLLRDGSVQSYVLQQFSDVEGGIEASLDIYYPAACPPFVIEEHLQHYAVEFRNGVHLAIAARNLAEEDQPAISSTAAVPAETGAIDGIWRIEGSAAGVKRSFDLTIRTDDTTASGTVSTADGRSVAFDGGTVSGSSVAFRASLGVKVAFNLTVDGDAVTGKMKTGMLPSVAVSGTRIS